MMAVICFILTRQCCFTRYFRSLNSVVLIFLLLVVFPGYNYAQNLVSSEQFKTQLLQTRSCVGCNLSSANLSGLDLSGVNLTGADLSNARLEATNLTGANLSQSTLLGVDLTQTKLIGSNLRGANLTDVDIDSAFEFIDLTAVQLEGARFKFGVVCGPFPQKGGWGCQHNRE